MDTLMDGSGGYILNIEIHKPALLLTQPNIDPTREQWGSNTLRINFQKIFGNA